MIMARLAIAIAALAVAVVAMLLANIALAAAPGTVQNAAPAATPKAAAPKSAKTATNCITRNASMMVCMSYRSANFQR